MAPTMGERFLMADPKYPIFMFDGMDLMIVSSAEKLQGDIERLDDQSEDSEVFDSEGRRVKLETRRWSTIEASVDVDPPVSIQEFVGRLRDFLRGAKDPAADDSGWDLPCLIEACRKHV